MTLCIAALFTVNCLFTDDLPKNVDLPRALTVQGEPFELKKSTPVVVIYLTPDCPIANRYAPVIEKLYQRFSKKVNFVRTYPFSKELVEDVNAHSKAYKLTSPISFDADMKLAKQYGFKVTPEVALIDQNRNIVYRGRIDGRNIEHGKETTNFRNDLEEALQEFLAGKPISEPVTQAQGCFLPID